MVHNALWTSGAQSPATKWSRSQDKAFEQYLVLVPETAPDRWDRIASQIPGKSATDVEQHYDDLVHDVMEIESGRVELPRYENESPSPSPAKSKGRDAERRKGVPWTDQEHILFLEGLKKYGRGDWRSISRNSVVTRTPTQVASHAQKYYLRLNSDGSAKKEKKRSSIHDITAVDAAGVGPGGGQSQAHYHKWAGPVATVQVGPSQGFRDQAGYFGYHGSGFSM